MSSSIPSHRVNFMSLRCEYETQQNPEFLLVSLATFLVAATSKASAVGHGHRERQDRLR